MKSRKQYSIHLISAVLIVTLVILVPATIAASGEIPPGAYATTITATDNIPPDFPPEFASVLMGTRVVQFDGAGQTIVTKNGEFVATGTYRSNKSHLVARDTGGPLAMPR